MKPRFTVDTHIFRELGQFLVGRDSTALAELVKNTYDADASLVTLYGEALDDPERGMIRIVDNGVGMTAETFRDGFLRIAGRAKEEGERRSPHFKRRYTGAKGIGRLAAQKLAGLIEIESVPRDVARNQERKALIASIDWDKVEAQETLEAVGTTDALGLSLRAVSQRSTSGTTITLRRLRRAWSGETLREFATELGSFRPAPVLTEKLPKEVVEESLLFSKPRIFDAQEDPGFEVKFEGEFDIGEDLYAPVIRSALWVIEIDASTRGVKYVISPTARTLEKTPFAKRSEFSIPHPDAKGGLRFQARILVRGRASSKKEAALFSGVRVFMEGFRVLPYGDPTDDWLRLKQDVTDRSRALDLDDSVRLKAQKDEGLFLLPPKHYAGGVFLTQNGSGGLEMVVNREGFVASAAFSNLQELVRQGIDLATRIRTQVDHEEERRKRRPAATSETEPADIDVARRRETVEESLATLHDAANELRELAKRTPNDKEALVAAAARIEQAEKVSRDFIGEHSFTRVLASVGLQLAAFVHELTALLGMTTTLLRSVGRLRESPPSEAKLPQELAKLQSSLSELRTTIERQSSYLIDIASPDARRRRSKQSLKERFTAAERLVHLPAARDSITIEDAIPEGLRTPPMFASELIAVFSNVLTNAVKAAGEHGHIRATAAARGDESVRFKLENTGAAVNLAEAEDLFQPFRSTTTKVDPVLGQGMGLGLTIARDILTEYGAKIRFVSPSSKFATALEISFPPP